METIWHDLRYGARMLAKNRGFTAVAVLTLALGIGANTAIFSTVNALLLRPFPFPQLDQLVRAGESVSGQKINQSEVAVADLLDWKNESQSFSALLAYRYVNANLAVNGEMDSVVSAAVSPEFFDVVGVHPGAGRGFLAEEGEQGRDNVAILSQRYWRRQFGGDLGILGRAVQINGRGYTVIGVMPAGYNFPLAVDVWTPLAFSPAEKSDRLHLTLSILGRMKPGVSFGQARAELQSIERRLAERYPSTNTGREITMVRLREEQYVYTAPLFLMLQAAALFVLVLACANLANLLFVRMLARQREIAIRTALGANRRQLARLFTSESVLLSFTAGLVAVAVSYWSVDLIRTGMPPGMTEWIAGWSDIRLDSRVLAFTLFLCMFVGIFFGLTAVLRASRVDVNQTLKESGGAAATPFGTNGLRSALACVQIVLAMVLLAGAAVLIKGFLRVSQVFQTLDPAHVLKAELALPSQRYAAKENVAAFYSQLLRDTAALPGVRISALASNYPASNVDDSRTSLTIEDRPALQPGEMPVVDTETASAGMFAALRIPLIEGRLISERDDAKSPPVAVINQTMARRYWPGASPIGQRVKLGQVNSDAPWLEIVGVVGDIKQNWFDPQSRPTIYEPYTQEPWRGMVLVLRTSVAPDSLAPAVHGAASRIDPGLGIEAMHSLEKEVDDSLAPIRIIGALMLIFGGVALALSAVGVYGLLAQDVAQRMREFGIRLALGAPPRALLWLVIGHALKLSGIGLALAVPISLVLTRVMRHQLFGLTQLDSLLLAGIAAALLLVAAAAGFLPARRAMRVDPMVALHYE